MSDAPMTIPQGMRNQEAIADLQKGVFNRMSTAAWSAARRCEDITKERGAGAYDAIMFARTQLDEAERQLFIFRELEAKRAEP